MGLSQTYLDFHVLVLSCYVHPSPSMTKAEGAFPNHISILILCRMTVSPRGHKNHEIILALLPLVKCPSTKHCLGSFLSKSQHRDFLVMYGVLIPKVALRQD